MVAVDLGQARAKQPSLLPAHRDSFRGVLLAAMGTTAPTPLGRAQQAPGQVDQLGCSRDQFVKSITQMFLVTPAPIVFQSGDSMFSRWPAESIHLREINCAPPPTEPLHAAF